ncbi:hypothetical protein [Algibacillus agarilyticus]|uniref:hypothetical protein n=1 Tax=Algibacillus agarilyticus TaxID=2234133 RepID=UPI000DCFB199|nr:hypothetical protein [Algibacillus agarilyticus]
MTEQTASQLWDDIAKSGPIKNTPKMSQDDLDQQSNRLLKQRYAVWFIAILISQLVIMNIVFVSQGAGWLTFDEVTLRIYTASTVIEVFGVIYIIVHNLFPTRGSHKIKRN